MPTQHHNTNFSLEVLRVYRFTVNRYFIIQNSNVIKEYLEHHFERKPSDNFEIE